MYKNFNLTDAERQEIFEMHQEAGYKQPLDEQGQYPFPPQNQQHGTPPPPNSRATMLPRTQFRPNPRLSFVANVMAYERELGRSLYPPEKQSLDRLLKSLKAQDQGHQVNRTPAPKVNNNDLTGDDKGQGVNFYSKPEEDILAVSATIDKIVKSGTGFDVYVSGDWQLNDLYYHWEPTTNSFQGYKKSTHTPLSWTRNGKTTTQTYYNKQLSAALKQKLNTLAPTSQPNDDIDFTSGNVNEQTSPSKYGTVTDDMNIIKQKMVGKPVRFFKDRELKTPAFNGQNFTFVNVERHKTYSDWFNISFKELGNEPLVFTCDKDGLYLQSKMEYVYNQTLIKYLRTALCNNTLKDDGKLKSVPNVKYAKNDTPNQNDPQQQVAETLNEAQIILKTIFDKLK